MSGPKRFVAGAVCPRCGKQDRLRVWRDEVREYRECIDCGYEDAMRLDGQNDAQELSTRVNQPRPSVDNSAQVVRFVANPALAQKKKS